MAKKTHPHKMVIFLKKNTKKFAFSVRKPIYKSVFPFALSWQATFPKPKLSS